MKTLSKLFIAIFALTVSCTALRAQISDEDISRYVNELRNYKHNFLAQELNLTRDQQRDFFEAYDAMEDQLMQLNSETRELERNVINNENATEVETEAAISAIFSQKQRESEIENSYLPRFREILTPGQLLRLKSTERQFNKQVMRQSRQRRRH